MWKQAKAAFAVSGAAALVGVLGVAPSAWADSPDGYAEWSINGDRGAFTGTADLADGFPTTTFSSDARSLDVSSGSSAWLPPGTPFADFFTSSQDRPYISLSPAANNSSSPSTTVFTFDQPAPAGIWGMNVGDIDAETVTISATVDGRSATASELGVRAPYNYCNASPRSSTCSGLPADGNPVPEVSDDGVMVTVVDPMCPGDSDRCNTTGESVWIVPTAPLTSLTITSTWKIGIPTMQLWVATLVDRVEGVVNAACTGSLPGAVELVTPPSEQVVSTATVDSEGSFAFDTVLPRDDYVLRASPDSIPPGVEVAQARVNMADPGPVSLTATSSFEVTGSLEGPPDATAGRVIDLIGDTGSWSTATTAQGAFRFENVPPGTYELSVNTTDGAVVIPNTQTVDVGCADVAIAPILLTTPTPTPSPTLSPSPIPTPTPTEPAAPGPSESPAPSPEGPRESSPPPALPTTGSVASVTGLWAGLALALVGIGVHVATRRGKFDRR